MEEALGIRLKLIIDNVELYVRDGQKILEKIKNAEDIADTDINEANMISAKLKLAIERFVTDMHNYYRLVTSPSADTLSTYTAIQIRAEELVVELNQTVNAKSQNSKRGSSGLHVSNVTSKLPKMELARFNGNVLKWHEFWDQFASNVDNRNINEVDKLLYLQSVLEGEAKRALEGLDTTNKNYQIAVSTLKERYGKPSAIVDAHYAALYKIKAADKSVTDCRRVFNEIQRHLRVLESLGEDVNHNHLRVMIMQKFSEDLIYELRIKQGSDSYSIGDIRSQIECIISAREASNRMSLETSSSEQPSTSHNNGRCSLETLHVATERRSGHRPKRYTQSNNSRDGKAKYGGKRDSRYHSESKFNNNVRKRHLISKEKEEVDVKKKKPTCIFCGNGHFNDECDEAKTVLDRKRKLEGRCFNCLAKGHRSSECRSRKKCYHCGKFGDHNRALCPSKDLTKTDNLHIRDTNANRRGLTVLQTAVVAVAKYNTLEDKVFRVLLDCGSQRSYVTRRVADLLNVPVLESNILSVFTFGAERPHEIESSVVRLDLKTRTNNKAIIYANVVPHITNGIPTVPNNLKEPLLEGLKLEKLDLADDCSMGDQVDILIGNDYYFSLMTGDKLKISDDLYLVNSIFGWVWSGKIVENDNYSDELSVLTYFQSSIEMNGFCEPDLPLQINDLRKLWDLESIGITDSPKTSRDEEAVIQFNDTTQYFDNRYHVKWPWIEFPPVLPSNFGLAHGRLVSLLKRLDKSTIQAYDRILREQLDQNIIEIVSDTTDVEHPVHYVPHHCISRGDKLRLVYDASAKTKGNRSLNECLYRGPLLLKDLTGLLIRFREHYVGVVADVEKAFLQIGLQEEDRDVTRFLWLKDVYQSPSPQNLLHLRFRRVPFGVISSPFLLNAVVRYHLKKAGTAVHDKIADDLYVDNLVTGCDSVDDVKLLYQVAKTSFSDLSMNLREWNSNLASFRDSIPLQYRSKEIEYMKVLGLNWNLQDDSLALRFEMTQNMEERTVTKRETLRLVASVFDPCGYAVPLILPAKLFLQNLWHEKVDWDTPFSDDMREQCRIAIESLKLIKDIKIPRCVKKDCSGRKTTYELHAFTDSSMQAYAAIVYLRISCSNIFTTRFIIGKGRLVGKEQQTDLHIPKLELLGALIGSRLIQTVLKYTRLPITKNFLWTDSQIVISWCSSDKLLPPFVAKRIDEIKRVVNLDIRHVPTLLNPADVATRPNASNDGINRWLQGPEFLSHDSSKWPHVPIVPARSNAVSTNSCGGQGLAETTQIVDEQSDRMDEEMTSVVKDNGLEGNKEDEEKELEKRLRQIQTEYYKKEINGVETDLGRSLGVYKDENGLLRCGGRLNNTNWCYDQKHPILLPRNHEMTFKIIETIHQQNYHVGVSHTLSLVRKKYWIPKGRSQVQKVLHRCQACRKYSGGPFRLPPMAPLPEERVTYSKPFTYTGLDYFGPILVSNNGSAEKRWVCLYTCLAVRAIHMEVVNDMTAEECLLGLRRFISTRGVPKLIVSDNATQFKLTAEIFTSDYCILNGTKWKFIPELAPWFGGFYERLIGIVKHCLKRTIDKHLLNHHQLTTVIKEVEAVVNSRPLTAVGSEPDHVLAPVDFLCAGRFSLPVPSEKEFLETATVTKIDLVDGWKRGQQILKEYIDMFINQYLASLRDRKIIHKQSRTTVQSVPQIGQLVQIKGGSNRTLWKVGRISSVSKSKDGNIRVAKVSVAPNETLTRSIAHLYPLEIPDSDESYQAPSDSKITDSDTNDTQVTSQEPNHVLDRRHVLDPARAPDQNRLRAQSVEQSTQSSENELQSENGAAQSARELLRPSRLSARRAREKVREWTTHLLISLRLQN